MFFGDFANNFAKLSLLYICRLLTLENLNDKICENNEVKNGKKGLS